MRIHSREIFSATRSLTVFLALLAAFSQKTVFGETWILNENQNDRYGDEDAQYNMKYWKSLDAQTNGLPSAALVAGDDYVVENNYQLSLKQGYVFTGNSLTVGGDSAGKLWLRGNKVEFPNAGLVLHNGIMHNVKWRSDENTLTSSSNLIGKVTVTASKTNPFVYVSSYNNFFLLMDGVLAGDGNAAIQIGGEASVKSNCLLVVNHADTFFGGLTVKSVRTAAGNDRSFGYGLGLGNSSYPGHITFLTGDTLLVSPKVGVTAFVNSLEFAQGARLRFSFDPEVGQAGLIDVYGSLGLPESGIAVEAEYAPVVSTTGEEMRCAILRSPAGMRLDAKWFSFSPDMKYEHASDRLPQRIHFEVETDASTDRDTLYAVIEPIVKLNAGKYYANWQDYAASETVGSPFTNATVWSDGRVPHEKAHYWIGEHVNLPLEHGVDWIFPGYSVIFEKENGLLVMLGKNKTFEVPLLEAGSMTLAVAQQSSPSVFCGGKVRLNDGCRLKLQVFKSNKICIDSELEGNFDVLLAGLTGYNKEFYLNALNTNFYGRIVFSDIGASTIDKCQTLVVADARNLGGDLSEFTYNALELAEFGRVQVVDDIVLGADANRGIMVTGDGGAFSVKTGATLKCHWPIAMNGTLWKFQEGTLALGGAVRFVEIDDGVTNLVDSLPEDVTRRQLIVTNGFLMALSPECVNGLTVKMAQNRDTGLVLDYATEDEELLKYGFRNVKTDTPFVGGKINVSVENVDDGNVGQLRRDRLGLVTVKTSVADDLAARLNVKRLSGRVGSLVREDDAETGWTIFSLKVLHGFVVNIR